ncbi:2'-5' RNA ligase family protein [Paractinoplanes rhizophilus]|jgi:2'-5' RNA ligase|uniref:2'-5' RNA ligase family protein n=1 Tax=Paractinoplanes rhizophilus TaxID=1416877 RepID=A0ABW2HRI7_9ACTN
MEPTHSALIIAVPEAEPVVGRHRERLDRAASWGVPAHITVLFPFLPPAEIDEHVLGVLGRVAAGVPAFFLTLDKIGWFGERVVWLAPRPAEPFLQLTAAVTARFPALRPYEGAFEEVIPHLTLGHDHAAADLAAAAGEVAPRLPIHARADTLRLITGRREPGESWLTRGLFPLG